jgi:ferredoxin
MITSAATLAYRRLRPDAPVGLLAEACLELHPRRVECARCAEACPVKVLSLTREGLQLNDGCLGCGRCMAVCPTGALAVHGFSLTLTPEPTLETLALDCWKVPSHLSPPGAVRVPCLGGLSVSRLLALRYVAGSRRFALLDRGWCGQCAAGRPDGHPALAATRDWLKEIGAPESHWPVLDKQPLAVSFQRQTIPDDADASPVKRRDFLSRLARQVAATFSEVGAFRIEEKAVGRPVRPVHGMAPLRAIEREHQLLLLEQLAARYGGSLPARFFPVVKIGPDCQDHRLCVNLCPTGALGSYQDNTGSGVKFDAAACIACGQCQRICPEHAVRLPARARRGQPRCESVTLTRHARRTCVECSESFATGGRETRCPACRKSRDFARAGFDTLFRDTANRKGRHKH